MVTEEDYVAYLRGGQEGSSRLMPPSMNLLMRRPFLFLGYGLRDWNLRVLLTGLFCTPGPARGQTDDRKSFAIARRMDGDEQAAWGHRRVDVQLREFAAFVPDLRADLHEAWQSAAP